MMAMATPLPTLIVAHLNEGARHAPLPIIAHPNTPHLIVIPSLSRNPFF